MKYKATINIDRELWDNFKDKCEERKTTASEEIRRFISLFVLEEETDEFDQYNYEDYPKTLQIVYNKIQGEILHYHDNRLDRIEARITKIEDGLKTDSKTDEEDGLKTDSKTDEEDGLGTDSKTDTTKTPILISSKSEEKSILERIFENEKIRVYSDKYFADLYDLQPKLIKQWRLNKKVPNAHAIKFEDFTPTLKGWVFDWDKNKDGLEDGLETDNYAIIEADSLNYEKIDADLAGRQGMPPKTYSDKEVFNLEPNIKSKTTVYRYRTGKSNPQDASFLDRWQVTLDGQKWLRKEQVKGKS